jgi:DNA (cytosine-5)-methyltransferase 1
MLVFGAIADHFRPTWIVWENVPGVLSSNGGRDFGSFIGMLGELGYGVAYRVLDAQYFGVAQRRRRVFVVGYLGDWRRAASVLFESESLSGHPAPSRETGKESPSGAAQGTHGSHWEGGPHPPLDRRNGSPGYSDQELFSQGGASLVPEYFESHPADSRITGPHDVGNTVSARYGTGGGEHPLGDIL